MLLFAYGDPAVVHVFLKEARTAARSIRRFNPNMSIAVITNNETVEHGEAFTHVIHPRADLLFAGLRTPSTSKSKGRETLAKQWTTRIIYMALSPFAITWALDSNVYQCPGAFAREAMMRFLKRAERTSLWGYDIAHANQYNQHGREKGLAYPHNFNVLYIWNERTSSLFRDWLMLQISRGIGTDDQKTLLQAEYRAQQMFMAPTSSRTRGLRVGQVPTEFAAAFYSPWMGRNGRFLPRVTRTLRGPAQIVHATPIAKGNRGWNGPEWCKVFNVAHHRQRQLVQVLPEAGARSCYKGCRLATIYNASDCRAALSLEGEAWPDEWTADASRSNRPAATSPQPVGPHVDEWEVMREEMDDGFDDGCPFSGGAMKRGEEGELLPVRPLLPAEY